MKNTSCGRLVSHLIFSFLLSPYAGASELLSLEPAQKLMTSASAIWTQKNGEDYNQKNWMNPVLHNIYMANNRSESAEFRVNLDNITKLTGGRLRFLDLLGSEPIRWESVGESTFKNKIQKYHSVLGLETSNIENKKSPVVLLFYSASHNLLSTATLDVVSDLSRKGVTVAMLEYPGYGATLGTPGKENWEKASTGAVEFLSRAFPGQDIYLLGHSIGSAVAFSAAASRPQLVSGVISHAGIYNLKEASKDSKKFFMSHIIAPLLTSLMASGENWDNTKPLKILAEKQVPVFIIHGRNDRSVSYRHFGLFTQKMSQLKALNPGFPNYSQSFASTHEVLFANETYGPYREIWDAIFNFIAEVEAKK